ncbi:hypothetical protein ACPCUF_19680 [Streptomyces griseoincarnatus]
MAEGEGLHGLPGGVVGEAPRPPWADGAARDLVAGRARQEDAGEAGVGRAGAVVEPEGLPTAGAAFGPGNRADVGSGAARPVRQPPRPR